MSRVKRFVSEHWIEDLRPLLQGMGGGLVIFAVVYVVSTIWGGG